MGKQVVAVMKGRRALRSYRRVLTLLMIDGRNEVDAFGFNLTGDMCVFAVLGCVKGTGDLAEFMV